MKVHYSVVSGDREVIVGVVSKEKTVHEAIVDTTLVVAALLPGQTFTPVFVNGKPAGYLRVYTCSGCQKLLTAESSRIDEPRAVTAFRHDWLVVNGRALCPECSAEALDNFIYDLEEGDEE